MEALMRRGRGDRTEAGSCLICSGKESDVHAWLALSAVVLLATAVDAQARTVYRCVRDGTVSLATAPEPGSKCVARHIDDNAVRTPNLWGRMGVLDRKSTRLNSRP